MDARDGLPGASAHRAVRQAAAFMAETAERARRIEAGDRRAMASLMRELDDQRPGARAELAGLAARLEERASPLVVGVTGAPGAGKSSLVDAMVSVWRAAGTQVGVIAVDPSSPLGGGGSILGDRIRMQRHATDDGVFIRSVASRGAAGGLSAAVHDLVAVLGCGGFAVVIVETVGVGQSEIDVTLEADVTAMVVVPGLGDGIQAMKAGLLELADVLVVNKGDRPGAEGVAADLRAMLELRRAAGTDTATSMFAATPNHTRRAEAPILLTVATTGAGVEPLVAAIESLAGAGAEARSARRQRRARAAILSAVTQRMGAELNRLLESDPRSRDTIAAVAERRLDVNDAADALMARIREQY